MTGTNKDIFCEFTLIKSGFSKQKKLCNIKAECVFISM